MRRRDFIKTGAIGAGLFASRKMLASSLGNANESPGHPESQGSGSMSYPARLEDPLSQGFHTPPATAKPHTWWHWMDGNVTKEGITADLEAMQSVGLGGVHIFNVSYQIPQGPINYMTQSIIGAESFTSGFGADRYTADPYSLKALGDFQFCEGINRFIFHRYALQPWISADRQPGMTMGPWGLHFDRTVTWWKQGRSYIEYLTRCQHMLQAGVPVSDILVFSGEDGESQAHWGTNTEPLVPEGCDYEFINASALLAASVQEGQIILPNGLRFRLLVLPESAYLTLLVAQKVSELVMAGAVLVGPSPVRTPGLTNYPACDKLLGEIATALWGESASGIVDRAVGRGRVISGKPLAEIMGSLHIKRDFAFKSPDAEAKIYYKHRRAGSTDVYFVSNQEDQAVTLECTFRVSGKFPEFWHADTGFMEQAAIYREAGGVVTMPVNLDPGGSIFVIFRSAIASEHAVAVTERDAAPLTAPQLTPAFELTCGDQGLTLNAWTPGDYEIELANGRMRTIAVESVATRKELDEVWNVSFPPNLGAPASIKMDKLISLSHHTVPGVRYFSGTSTYTREFEIDGLTAMSDIYLDLGEVKNLAEVRINNTEFGMLWKPPFRVNITPALRSGVNHIEVKITNVWANRLIGDEQLPDDREWVFIPGGGWRLKQWPEWFVENKPRPVPRIAFSTWKFYSKDDPLPESGLIGPVALHTVQKIRLSSSRIPIIESRGTGMAVDHKRELQLSRR